jgi:hypothetical protein
MNADLQNNKASVKFAGCQNWLREEGYQLTTTTNVAPARVPAGSAYGVYFAATVTTLLRDSIPFQISLEEWTGI